MKIKYSLVCCLSVGLSACPPVCLCVCLCVYACAYDAARHWPGFSLTSLCIKVDQVALVTL